jgi:hypothetical protein
MIALENAANNGITRRTFAKLAAIGLVGAGVPLHPSSKLYLGTEFLRTTGQ